jgi:hypothetical protein
MIGFILFLRRHTQLLAARGRGGYRITTFAQSGYDNRQDVNYGKEESREDIGRNE